MHHYNRSVMLLVLMIVSIAQSTHCGLKHYVNKDTAYDSAACPADLDKSLLTITDQYILSRGKMLKALKKKEIGGDFNFIHFGHKYYPQWLLSYYEEENVMFLYFQGTELYRLPEIMIDLDITHKEYDFVLKTGKDDVIRTSGSMTSMIDRAHAFHHMLEQELKYIFKKYEIDEDTKKEMKFGIAGTSLGAAYANWWFLGLYTKIKLYEHIREKFIGEYFPSDLSKITVILMGAPLTIFHKDVHKIPKDVRDRVLNFILPLDPVPMLAGGHHALHIDDDTHIYKREGWKKLLGDRQKRIGMASNGPLGKYYILSERKKISITKKIGRLFSKKKSKTEEKSVCPLQEMDSEATETHLGRGGFCLWDKNHLDKSMLGLAHWFMKYHAKGLPSLLTDSTCKDEDALKDVDEKHIFYIKYCEPKNKDLHLSKCYDYHKGEKENSDDFINEIAECDCYEEGGAWKHLKTGYKSYHKIRNLHNH